MQNNQEIKRNIAAFVDENSRYTDRERLFGNAPEALCALLEDCGIKSTIDHTQLRLLANHTGLNNGPRDFIFIHVDGHQISLSSSSLVSLCLEETVLFDFINQFEKLTTSCTEILTGNISTPDCRGFRGDIFYYDISIQIETDFGKKSAGKAVFYSLMCKYLRKHDIWVHS